MTQVQPTPEQETRFKKLLYHSQQRGWLELDLIIGSWVKRNKDSLITNEESMNLIEGICAEENSDLMRWLCEGRPLPEKYQNNPVMKDLMTYAQSPDKPWAPKVGEGNQ